MNKALSFDFHHIGVSVPNLEEAIAWYKHVLGFEVEKEFYIEAAKSKTAMMRSSPSLSENLSAKAVFYVIARATLSNLLSKAQARLLHKTYSNAFNIGTIL